MTSSAVFLLLALAMSSCGLAKHPLKPVMTADVKTIELARLEVNHILLIRRLNPLFAIMGSSGMVLDAVIVAGHARKYKKRAGQVNRMCIKTFTQTLAQALRNRGYKVGLSQKRYWDYYKKKQKIILDRTDAILRIKLKQMGFWSPGLRHPFVPSVFVQAELIDPVSREVLYGDRFAMGIDTASLKLMALGYGKAVALPNPDAAASYQSFAELLEKPDQSRDALLTVISVAAGRIAAGFHRRQIVDRAAFFEPHLFTDMPEIQLPAAIKSGNRKTPEHLRSARTL